MPARTNSPGSPSSSSARYCFFFYFSRERHLFDVIPQHSTSIGELLWEKERIIVMRSTDRISALPDSILLHILSLVPFKSVARTSSLSKRWEQLGKELWAYSSTLDFGKEFTNNQSRKEYTSNVNRFLELHAGKEINKLCISFYPGEEYEHDVARWIRSSTGKGVEELDINLSGRIMLRDCDEAEFLIVRKPSRFPLSCVLDCDTLKNLHLCMCRLTTRLKLDHITSLRSLNFRQVGINDYDLENLLQYSPHLEELTLRECDQLKIIDISSPFLRLRSLRVVQCLEATSLKIKAPTLLSFHFDGYLFHLILEDVSSLVDAFVSDFDGLHFELEASWRFMSSVVNVKILTIYSTTLVNALEGEELAPEHGLLIFPNLQELQLLVNKESDLQSISRFFELCPCPLLERLFIEFPTTYMNMEQSYWPHEEPAECIFDRLRTIKMKGFWGGEDQLVLIRFFLEKVVALETMILVATQSASSDVALVTLDKKLVYSLGYSMWYSMCNLIALRKHSEDDTFLPTHKELYNLEMTTLFPSF